MNNFIQEGCSLTLTAPYAVSAGGGFKVGSIIAIAHGDAANGAEVVGLRVGVFNAAKATSQSWTEGAKLYWDDTNKVFTTTSSGNTLAGVAAAAAGSSDTTGSVLLDGAVR
jgi:predicted RecA/RadA family phage recombinase